MASGIFDSLLRRLNSVFNKDPQTLTAFQIKPPAKVRMVIANQSMVITAVDQTQPIFTLSFADPYDSNKSISIKTLYGKLSTTEGFTLSNLSVPLSGVGAIAIVDGDYTLSPDISNPIPAATSVLWSIYKPLAWVLEQAKNDIDKAIQQIGFVSAEGEFLDYWGTIFGIARYTDEPDYEYSIRLLWETVKPRLNNKAIEDIISRGTRYQTTVADFSSKILLSDGYNNPIDKGDGLSFQDDLMVSDGHIGDTGAGFPTDPARYGIGERYTYGSFGVFVDVPISNAYYQYTTPQLQDIVERHRAAGTTPFFIISQIAAEVLSLIDKVVVALEADIQQESDAGRVMLFGYDDLQFYADHWDSDNVSIMPWYQNNLNIPSLSDNVVIQSQQVIVPPQITTSVEGLFTSGSLGDGFAGSFNRNLLIADASGNSDEFQFRLIATQFPVGQQTIDYLLSPVILQYKRITDEYIIPRIVEMVSDDTLVKSIADINAPVTAFQGAGRLTNVGKSTDVVQTSPLIISAPTSISGIKFNQLALEQANLHDLPIVVRNLEIDNFGANWNKSYSGTRRWLIPYQDTCGNRYYFELQWPAYQTPPVSTLRITNPTATISADFVQIQSGDTVNISWNVTNAVSVILRRELVATGVIIDLSVGFTGTNQYSGGSIFAPMLMLGLWFGGGGNAITQTTKFHIIATGNNGQIAEATTIVTVLAKRSLALPALINPITVSPDVVQFCQNNTATISYTVDFRSLQTEDQVLAFPADQTAIVVTPLSTDPVGTTIMAPRQKTDGTYKPRLIIVSRTGDGLIIEGAWTGLDTSTAIFTPIRPFEVQGKHIAIDYDVNYAGSVLSFNGNNVPLPNQGNVWKISQQIDVTIPPPSIAQQTNYVVNYVITADNYATAATSMNVPVYVQTIQVGAGVFSVKSITPSPISEAIGPTVNQTVLITATGTGFSANMAVYLKKPALLDSTSNTFTYQYIQATVVSVDWNNGIIKFIAPRVEFGTYPLKFVNMTCTGLNLGSDETKSLTYNRSTFRDAPIITEIQPATFCLPSSGGNTLFGTFFAAGGSTRVKVLGKFFRAGAIAYVWVNGVPVAKNTVVTSASTANYSSSDLIFTWDNFVAGVYDISVVNTDTSSGFIPKAMNVLAPNTLPVITDFGYKAPLDISGCAFYGTPFTLHWSTTQSSGVIFTSSDPEVTVALTPPLNTTSWPPNGSLTVPVSTRGTTISLIATNVCNNTAIQTVTINDQECERTIGIKINPSPVRLTDRLAYKIHTVRNTFNTVTKKNNQYDITSDPLLRMELVGPNDESLVTITTLQGYDVHVISLVGLIATANHNGYVRIKATWNGFVDTAAVYVELPKPISLEILPNPILYTNINQKFQLQCIVTYSDGTTIDVTSHPDIRYHDFSSIISVNATGTITTNEIGSTVVTATWFDRTIEADPNQPLSIVNGSTEVGKQDPCIVFDRFYIDPEYSIVGNAQSVPVSINVTGANPNSGTLVPDASGNASYTYTGLTAGLDTVLASTSNPSFASNRATVLWFDPVFPLCTANMEIRCFPGDGSGINDWNGFNPYFTMPISSFSMNDGIVGIANDRRPVQATVVDSAGNLLGTQTVQGNGFSLGVGVLNASTSIITGILVVKTPGNYQFNFRHDDGFMIGIQGATRVSGDYLNIPSSGLTPYKQYPVMGGYNESTSPHNAYITVNFPTAGLYPFEIDWADFGERLMLETRINGNGLVTALLPNITIPANVVFTNPATLQNGLTLSQTTAGPLVVGQTFSLNLTALNIHPQTGNTTLHASAFNVRSAYLNGLPIYNGELQPVWSYVSIVDIETTKKYVLTIKNMGGSITSTSVSNVLSFPKVSIDKFAIYDASKPNLPETTGPLTINFGTPLGFLWKTNNAVKVTLSDNVDNPQFLLAGAGSRYDTPWSDRVYTLTAFAPDGSFIQSSISVTVNDYRNFTHDWKFGPWYNFGNRWVEWSDFLFASSTPETVRIGQTSTLELPEYDWSDYSGLWWDNYHAPILGWPFYGSSSYDERYWRRTTNLNVISDNTISTDGTRPIQNDINSIYARNVEQSDQLTVSPSTNSIYQFAMYGNWFWYFWDSWPYRDEIGNGIDFL